MYVEILSQAAIRADTFTCEAFFLGTLSPSYTLLLCLSLTEVYMLISNCSSTCDLQTFWYIYTMINIHKTQSHIHSHQLMYL